jgi:hypothetical protein
MMKFFPKESTQINTKVNVPRGLTKIVKSEIKTLNRLKGTMDFDKEQDNFKRIVMAHLAKMEENK